MRGELPGQTVSSGAGGKKAVISMDDDSLLLSREYTCPVCKKKFSAMRVDTGKAHFDGQDIDLRPKYKNIDVIKYRVIECPHCNYADLDKYFNDVSKKELAVLREHISAGDDDMMYFSESGRDYETAYMAYKSALSCNLIRGASYSKRGLAALYTAWLLRGWRESLEEMDLIVKEDDKMGLPAEDRLLRYAFRNFRQAELKEADPSKDIGEYTLDYIMAALSYILGNYGESRKYLMNILSSRGVDRHIRNKAENLRDLIRESDEADNQIP